MRCFFHLFFQDEQIFCPGTDNTGYIVADFFHGPGDWMENGNARAASDTDYLSDFVKVGSLAEWPDNILVAVANLEVPEKSSGLANNHVNNGNGALVFIGIGHGKGNPLPVLTCF